MDDLRAYTAQDVFHRIDVGFPGLQCIHREPFIFLVRNFASEEECARLMAVFHTQNERPSATTAAQEGVRTSSTVFPPSDEVRWLRERIARLVNCTLEQLEPLKVTRYQQGQYFAKHTDASFLNEKLWALSAKYAGVDEDGLQDPCEWPGRFCSTRPQWHQCPHSRAARH